MNGKCSSLFRSYFNRKELLYVLLDIKPIVDLFLSFVESFSRLDREFDKPMIFFRLS
uniref:Uncharacterized protein n=1 Tax=Aegilops tauschii subsp. strangulata TaxID=200361 RepID=A0A452XDH9_AEGTS